MTEFSFWKTTAGKVIAIIGVAAGVITGYETIKTAALSGLGITETKLSISDPAAYIEATNHAEKKTIFTVQFVLHKGFGVRVLECELQQRLDKRSPFVTHPIFIEEFGPYVTEILRTIKISIAQGTKATAEMFALCRPTGVTNTITVDLDDTKK